MTLDEALERIALQARTITEQAAEIDRLRAEIAAAVEAARPILATVATNPSGPIPGHTLHANHFKAEEVALARRLIS